tara:strand:- start:198 stop:2480 length:2283 start_codon:yes stop_codon:yes gene_type:complete
MNFDHVPTIIKSTPQWILWKMENGNKIPKQVSGANARTNDHSTFSTFEQALDAFNEDDGSKFSGLAFVISDGDNFSGVDLDNCLDDDGNPKPWAAKIMAGLRGVAYGEISPSGNGVKFLTYGKKTPGARCVKQFGGPKEQVECYDRTRFWAMTGNCIGGDWADVRDGQEVVTRMCSEYFGTQQQRPERTQPAGDLGSMSLSASRTAKIIEDTDSELDFRARSYIESCGSETEGGRNNSGFKIAGHLRSLEADGQRMTDAQIYSYMHLWNESLPSPLPRAEMDKAIWSSGKNGTAREVKPSDEVVRELPSMTGEYARISDETDPNEFLSALSSEVNASKGIIPDDCLSPGGLLGEVMAFNRHTAMFWQQELALAASISLMSLMIGRRFTDYRDTRANLYCIGLAPSGSGKEHARKVNKAICNEVFGDTKSCPDSIGSDAGLVRVASEREALFQIDEVAKFMAVNKTKGSPWLAKIAPTLLRLFTSSGSNMRMDELADGDRAVDIKNPYVSVYGTSTVGGWWNSMDTDALVDGLIARLIVFEVSEAYPSLNRESDQHAKPSQSLINRLKAWAEYTVDEGDMVGVVDDVKAKVIQHTEEAMRVNEGYAEEVRCMMRDLSEGSARTARAESVNGIWARAGEKVAKLALISACSRNNPDDDFKIEVEDVRFAIKLVDATTARMISESGHRVSSSKAGRAVSDIHKLVLNAKATGVTKEVLIRDTMDMGRRMRDDAIKDLTSSKSIEFDSDTGRYYALIKTGGYDQ